MSVEFNSFSSALMFRITLYRNESEVGKKVIGQLGYALTTGVSIVETIAALAFSLVIYPFSSGLFEKSIEWLSSCGFSIIWSIADFVLNPFCSILVADEQSARLILENRNLMHIPAGAVIRERGFGKPYIRQRAE